ncbi:MAG: CDP-6-deoxy-delta-3,4-glucoseen reductase [Rhodocyclaceae bacterium]|nr:CDP-6-deoxy-delta-3,4-glucoseen reductase [Rhodocyclaceae bacterium]
MSFQVTLQPSGLAFSAPPENNLLDSALHADLLVPHGCRDGACGACKARVVSGDVTLERYAENALSAADRAKGLTLLCRAHPTSDVVLEVNNVQRTGDIPIKKLPCRVQRLEKVAPDVMLLDIKLPASEQFRFRAGQYVDFLLAGGKRRSFSIANAPHDADHLEFHIRLVPGGEFTAHVFEKMKEKDILRLEGPLGSFFLREDDPRPIILLGGGTGFAPLKSIVEHAIHTGFDRPMALYWGSRDRAGLYLEALARSWEGQLPGFKFIPVLSDSLAEETWPGRRGLVHQAVLEDFADLSGHRVYACGAPIMIDAARQDFSLRGLPDEAFLADSFTFSANPNS